MQRLSQLHLHWALIKSLSLLLVFLFAFLFLRPGKSYAQSSCTQTLSPGANLVNVLASAAAGSVICLQDGSYSAANFYSSKSTPVTVRAINTGGASIGYSDINAGNGLIIDGVNIGGALISGNARNITIQNSVFTSGLCINMRNVAGSTNYPLNITIDNNVFDNLGPSCFEGRISISDDDGHQNSMGVTIKNNKIKNGCQSDGIFVGGGASGVTIGPNNEFSGINQSGPVHCDNIQYYGSGWNNTIEGNFFNGGSTLILIDGNDNGIIRNNVFKAASGSPYPLDVQNACPSSAYPILIEHNTVYGASLRINYYCNATIKNNAFVAGGSYDTSGAINCTNCTASYNIASNAIYGANSLQGTVSFAGGSKPTSLTGFQLASNSPGKNAGSDGLDMGTTYYGTPTVDDTTPPTSPTTLTATSTSQSSITVSWTAATDNIGVDHYLIERCTGLSCSNFSQVGSVSASPFTDSGLSASTGYSYHVRAIDGAGNMSGWSNVVSATTLANPTFSSCNTVTTSNFSQSAYNSYGAPFDAFSTSIMLINATCSSSDSHTIQATLGQTGDTTRIVYTKGYYYANSTWTQYSGTCTGAQNGDWCQGSVSATITDPNLSTASASTPAYFVGMTCSVQGGGWKCGCRDTSCSNFYWQVQGAGQ